MTEAYKDGVTKYGVGIHIQNRKMPFTFGNGLKEEEKRWIIGELCAFRMDVKSDEKNGSS